MTYSLATRFMPSRSGVTSITSPVRYSGDELVEREVLVLVVQGRMAEAAVDAVDLADELLDLAALVLVVLDALPRRRGDLHHHARSMSSVPSSSSDWNARIRWLMPFV